MEVVHSFQTDRWSTPGISNSRRIVSEKKQNKNNYYPEGDGSQGKEI